MDLDFIGLVNPELEWRNDPQERILREVAKAKGLAPGIAHVNKTQIDAFVQGKASLWQSGASLPLKNGIYRPIQDARCIRVLDLQPSSDFASPLHCSLRPVSVEFEYPSVKDKDNPNLELRPVTDHAIDLRTGEPVFYTALSYLWGPPDFTSEVWVYGEVAQADGVDVGLGRGSFDKPQRHAITANLDAAMRHLRDAEDAVTLWIDQLCIDQADIAEKSSQIALMSLVYRRAVNTSIWLGPEPEHIGDPSTGAFEILHAIQGSLNLTLDISDSTIFKTVDLPCPRHEAYKSLAMLFRRPWFSRVWIIQEAVLSRRRVVRCGQGVHRRTMDWEDLGAASMTAMDSGFLDWLRAEVAAEAVATESSGRAEKATINQEDESGLTRGAAIARELNATSVNLTAQLNSSAPMPPSLLLMLSDTRYADATNPCDKIYGVLALVGDKIAADYSVPASEAYRRAMLTTINGSAVLDVGRLQKVFASVDHEPMADTPSWVPDWSRPRTTISLSFSTMTANVYSAGSGFSNTGGPRILDNGKTVEISGELVDIVHELTKILVDPGELILGGKAGSTYAGLEAFAKQYEVQRSEDEGNFDAFWKTLVAGKDAVACAASKVLVSRFSQRKCLPSYREAFDKVLHASMTPAETPAPTDSSVASARRRKSKAKPKKEKLTRAGKLRAWEKLLPEVQSACNNAIKNRRMCITQGKRLALVPGRAEKADVIAVFASFRVPFVLRPREDGTYQLIGECYVHGMMDGGKRGPGQAGEAIRVV